MYTVSVDPVTRRDPEISDHGNLRAYSCTTADLDYDIFSVTLVVHVYGVLIFFCYDLLDALSLPQTAAAWEGGVVCDEVADDDAGCTHVVYPSQDIGNNRHHGRVVGKLRHRAGRHRYMYLLIYTSKYC